MRPSNDHVYKFKPRTNNLRHLLDDGVLDDETRKSLMKDVLEGGRPRPTGAQPQIVSTTSASSQATAGPASASRHRASVPMTPTTPSTQQDSGTTDLLVVMTQRLRTLESQCNVLQKELREKSAKAIEFEDKYRAERATRKELEEGVKNLESQCDDQLRQINEMHAFLSDYGLTWVGGSATSSPSTTPRAAPPKFDFFNGNFDSSTTVTAAPTSTHELELDQTRRPEASAEAKRKIPFDLDKLKRNALILTDHVGLTGLLPGAQPNSKQIKDRDMVYVAVYLDGISVNSGLFRPYGWPLCDAILDDLLEGFYPYEFREKYPDGFPITVVDKSSEMCPTGLNAAQKSAVQGLENLNDHGYKPLTREALLKKLPERFVTANGHLVQVRGSMAQMLSGGTASASPPSLISADTAASRAVSGVTSQGATTPEVVPTANNVTALQIKLPQGHKISLHMYFQDTIDAVRRELEKAAPFFKPQHGYELTTAFPRMTYDDHSKTLEALGLVPNGAAMMIKILPGPTE